MKKLNAIFFMTALAVMSFVFASGSLHAIQNGKNIRKGQIAQADDTQNTNPDTQTQQNVPSIGEKPGTIPNSMMPRKEPMGSDSAEKATESMTIPEIVSSNPSFSTLDKAIKVANLTNALSAPGPYTIFAPTDTAFAKLSPNTVADLLNPDNQNKLKAILTYDIVPGKITAENFKNMKVRTLNGKPLEIKVNGDEITVNNAKINATPIKASNGIIYTIDSVIQP